MKYFRANSIPTSHGSFVTRKEPSRSFVFGIIAIGIFMASLDLTIVSIALPDISRQLHASINWAGWTITIYGIGIIVALPIAGKLSDYFGRRHVFLFGIALFTLSSLMCGLASNIYVLVAFRALQAAGGGTIQPSAAGLVADHFGENRDRAIGLFGTIAASGSLVGPIVGGVLIEYWSWRGIFLVNVPIGIVLILLVMNFIPRSPKLLRTKIDVHGILLMASFLLLGISGISFLGDKGTRVYSPLFLIPEVCALVLVVLFVRHSNRADSPFISLRYLRGRGFAVMNVENVFLGFIGFGVASLVPLYAEERYQLTALSAGTLLTARAVGMIAVGALAAFALRRTGYRPPLIFGFSFIAIGTLAMSSSPLIGMSPYIWLSVCAGIIGLGTGAALPASRNAYLQLAPAEVATLSGLCSMFQFSGAVLSVTVVTAIVARSSNASMAQSHVYVAIFVFIVLVMIPLVARVPKQKGTW